MHKKVFEIDVSDGEEEETVDLCDAASPFKCNSSSGTLGGGNNGASSSSSSSNSSSTLMYIDEDEDTLVHKLGYAQLLYGGICKFRNRYDQAGTMKVLFPRNCDVSIEQFFSGCDVLRDFMKATESFSDIDVYKDLLEDLETQSKLLDNYQTKLRNGKMEKLDEEVVEKRDKTRSALLSTTITLKADVEKLRGIEELVVELHESSKTMKSHVAKIAKFRDRGEAERMTILDLDIVKTKCSDALRREKQWETENDVQTLRKATDDQVQALTMANPSLGILCKESDLETIATPLKTCLDVLRAEHQRWQWYDVNSMDLIKDLPGKEVLKALHFVEHYCNVMKAKLDEFNAGFAEVEALSASLSKVEQSGKPSLEEAQKYEEELVSLNGNIKALFEQMEEAKVNLQQAEENDVKELNAVLEQKKRNLELEKDSMKARLPILLSSLRTFQGNVRKQAESNFPELLHDPRWRVAVKGVDSPALKYLELESLSMELQQVIAGVEALKDCPICGDTMEASNGVECENGHFCCNECFDQHVQCVSELGSDEPLRKAEGGCPCYDPDCESQPFSQRFVALHVSEGTFETYLAAIKRTVEQKTVQCMESQYKAKQKQLERKIGQQEAMSAKVNKHVEHITENILTLKCPRNGHAFVDFNGCFALQCHRCNPVCAFCAWCLADCGRDAHVHVASCPYRKNSKLTVRVRDNQQQYFGTKEAFEEAQRARQKRTVEAYWKEKVRLDPPSIQAKVKERILPILDHAEIKKVQLPVERPITVASSSSSSSSSSSGGAAKRKRSGASVGSTKKLPKVIEL